MFRKYGRDYLKTIKPLYVTVVSPTAIQGYCRLNVSHVLSVEMLRFSIKD